MVEITSKNTEAIYRRVKRDLLPSEVTVWSKIGLALVPGGLLSMFFCGQFGMGLTTGAEKFYHLIHHQVGSPLLCAAICGALFSVFPVIVLRLISHPLQFRYVLTKKILPLVTWFAMFVGLLSYHGEVGADLIALLLWVVMAYVVFYLLGRTIFETEKLLTKRVLSR